MKIYVTLLLLVTGATISLCSCNSKSSHNSSSNISTTALPEKNDYDSTALQDVYYKLKRNETLSKAEIDSFAGNVETRAYFYTLLTEFNKESLFPAEQYTFEKFAESNLVNWLLYPTELDAVPSKIELVKKVDHSKNGKLFIYYVFKFKTEEPHWAAKDGWMLGVAGPYFKNGNPHDWINGTFSRLTKVGDITPEKEVEWTHNNIYEKSPNE